MYLSQCCVLFFFFKQKTAYEMRISDWSSDVCSSDLVRRLEEADRPAALLAEPVDLGHREVDVPQRHHADRDEATRVGAAPLVDGPVAVGLEHHEGQPLDGRLVERAGGETGHGGEVHRRQANRTGTRRARGGWEV